MSTEAQPIVNVLAADSEAGLPIAIGMPFQQGSVQDPTRLGMISPSGQPLPVSTKPLVHWPDGSVRWGLLTFQATETGAHRVEVNGNCPPVEQPVTLSHSGSKLIITNGLTRVVLDATGPGPISEIKALGHRYLARPEDWRFVVNAADTTHEGDRAIQVMEESPLRVRVRISGAHVDASGARLLHYRLDVELWAGWPAIRLDYHFFNHEPGRENIAIDRMAMECKFTLGQETQRHFEQSCHGLMFIPREVFNPAPVAIVSDDTCGPAHVEDPAMLLDDTKYPAHLRPPLVGTSEWLGIGDGSRSLYVRMQDFIQMRPNRLASSDNELTLEFWPTSKGTLELPQGRSRRQSVTLAFNDQGWLSAEQAERLLNGLLLEGRATIDPAWLRHCGEFEIDRLLTPGDNIRFEKFLRRSMTLNMQQDMFDLGDTVDSWYCRTYAPIPNNSIRKPNAPAIPRVFSAGVHSWMQDSSFPQFYEPVWTNNEYDGIYVLCSEIMRTGLGDLWTQARWAVRHNIEVDFVHYHDDKQQNRATPQHSVRHNTSGSIPSHYWTQGLLQYYCMTGDQDVLEIAIALGDKIIEDFTVPEFRESFWSFTRELGWPTLALTHLYDVTREPRFLAQLEEMLDYFMKYDRGTRVDGQPTELERIIASGLLIWSCMFEGVDLFQRHSGRTDLKAWMVEFLHSMRIAIDQFHREGAAVLISAAMVLAIGYEQTGDERFLRTGMVCLDEFFEANYANTNYWLNLPPETKPVAIVYRGLIRFLGNAHRAGLLQQLDYPSARANSSLP